MHDTLGELCTRMYQLRSTRMLTECLHQVGSLRCMQGSLESFITRNHYMVNHPDADY